MTLSPLSYPALAPLDELSSYSSPSIMEDFSSVASSSSNTPYTPATKPLPLLPMCAPPPDDTTSAPQADAETRELHLLDQICELLSRDQPKGADGVIQNVRAQREAQARGAQLAAELQRIKKKVRAREREVVALRNRIERQTQWAGRIEREGRDGVRWS